MTRLIINGIAGARSSRGVAHYERQVAASLAWTGPIERLQPSRWAALDRARELTFVGAADAVFWSPTHRGTLFGDRHVVTVHDCINVEFVYAGGWQEAVVRAITQRMLENAAQVVSISEATKESLLLNYRLGEDRIRVIRSACEESLSRIDLSLADGGAEATVSLQAEGPYALMVTNALPHKNTAFACTALSLAIPGRVLERLRVVGELSPEAYEVCARHGLKLSVERNVNSVRLAALYRNAEFVLSPSLAEGHNLVIAEALGCGARVVCSDIAAHREFYEGSALMFNPTDLDDAVHCIRTLHDEPAQDLRMVFSRKWSEVGDEYLKLFESLAKA